ncbi:AMP-binding protein [Aurantibacillus circumpalustris]|uniref:AMP-binding protein n=1 Tax=Aurantibacillus circumpalustris TaxID=3036359 RepID=UPI00295A5C56|nr:AMP-binding protein [Aurantibacillus circumpalustris]
MLTGFFKSALKFPNHTAIIINGKKFTYQWILNKAISIAQELIVKDKSETNLIGLYTDNNENTYASLIAILLSNKGFVPLNHKFPNDRLKKMINDAGIKTILHSNHSLERVNELQENASLPVDDLNYNNQSHQYEFNESQIVYILFTSGSTGIPKGISITNRNFSALIKALDKRFKINETDIVLQAFELSFDVSLACTFMAWERGAALLVPDMDGIVAVNSFKAIYEYKATFVTIPPSAIFYLKKLKMLGSIKIPSVHTTLFTGEALPLKLAIEWQKSAENSVVENAYGPTETTVWCLFYKLDENTENQTINGLCPIGEGLSGINFRIINEKNEDVIDGERGELIVEGDQIFKGYWNNSEKTAQAFYIDSNEKKWYKTGDIVVKNKNKNVVYINRKDNQVQVNGFRVELGEVEHAIKQASGLDSIVVLAKITDEYTDLYALIEGKFEQDDLVNNLKNSLPFYMIPRHFIAVNPLPVNTSGKIDKQLLHKIYLS